VKNWGKIEHKWESYTSRGLFIGVLGIIGWWWTKWNWLSLLVYSFLIISWLCHVVARFAHRMEKRTWSRRIK
jgi:hypothetical protein